MHRVLILMLVSVLCVAMITPSMAADVAMSNGPRVTTVQPGTTTVLVDDEPFLFKGFNYVGSAIPDHWPPVSFAEDVEACRNDAPLLAGAGVNAVRLWWGPGATTLPERELACLDAFWEHGIGVVWTLLPQGNVQTEAQIEAFKPVMDDAVARFGDHPATLVWTLGNEVDLGGCKQLDPVNGCYDHVFGVDGGQVGILNDAYVYMHSIDPNHLVGSTVSGGFIGQLGRVNLPDLDIWGVQMYPGLWGPLYDPQELGRADFENALTSLDTNDAFDPDRPKIFTEIGGDRLHCIVQAPALNSGGCRTNDSHVPPPPADQWWPTSGEWQQLQAEYLATAWDTIADHLSAEPAGRGHAAGRRSFVRSAGGSIAGVTFFMWADMWNKCSVFCAGVGTATTHDVYIESRLNSAEWWGVAHAIPLGADYTRTTSLGFDALARRWSAVPPPTITVDPVVTPQEAPCQYVDGELFRFRATWTTSEPATTEVYTSLQGEVLNDGGLMVADNSIYEPAVVDETLVTDHDATFTLPVNGRGRVIVRSFTADGRSVTWPPISTWCDDVQLAAG